MRKKDTVILLDMHKHRSRHRFDFSFYIITFLRILSWLFGKILIFKEKRFLRSLPRKIWTEVFSKEYLEVFTSSAPGAAFRFTFYLDCNLISFRAWNRPTERRYHYYYTYPFNRSTPGAWNMHSWGYGETGENVYGLFVRFYSYFPTLHSIVVILQN